jgi:hypothetical protein
MSPSPNPGISTAITYPLVVARTIMYDQRSQHFTNIFTIINHILKEKGVKGLYAGLKPDLIRLLPSNTIVFVVYELMKNRFQIP